jgi:hypothetical protein
MTTKGASAVQVVPWDTVNLLRPFFDKGPETLAARLLDLPMLRGAWAGSVDSGGDWYDISGHGHHLTYNGNPTFNYDGLIGYWDYDGTGDYHSRLDEADLDITGLETYVAAAARGLTMGGYFYIDAFPAALNYDYLIGKWGAGNETYLLCIYNGPPAFVLFIVRNTALGINVSVATTLVTTGQWYSFIGRYIPSTEIALFVNGIKYTNLVNVPVSLPNTAANFVIGADSAGTGNLFDGRASHCFLCAAALSDAQINVLYQMSKRLFGH